MVAFALRFIPEGLSETAFLMGVLVLSEGPLLGVGVVTEAPAGVASSFCITTGDFFVDVIQDRMANISIIWRTSTPPMDSPI